MRERKQGRTVSAYLNYEEAQAFDALMEKETVEKKRLYDLINVNTGSELFKEVSENQIIKKALREYLEREGEHG